MSESVRPEQVHDEADPDAALRSDDCSTVLARVYEFLDHEIDTADGDQIREHLAACEPCLETFDAEQAFKSLLQRRCGGDQAPDHLRLRVMAKITRTQIRIQEG